MKKWFLFLLTLSLLISSIGCTPQTKKTIGQSGSSHSSISSSSKGNSTSSGVVSKAVSDIFSSAASKAASSKAVSSTKANSANAATSSAAQVVLPGGLTKIKEYATFYCNAFIISEDNSLWGWGSWGHSNFREPEKDNMKAYSAPTKVMQDVKKVSGFYGCIFVIKMDNTLWAFGENATTESAGRIWGTGLLGIGSTELAVFTPTKVMDNVKDVVVHNNRAFAVKMDGTLWGWGANYYGQLGTGNTQDASIPTKVMDNVASVFALSEHSYALKTDGSLWGFGTNSIGELGNGEIRLAVVTPVKILDNVKSISSRYAHALALKTDGSLWGWGWNAHGQVGNGQTTNVLSPVKIMDHVKFMETDTSSSCVIKTDDSLWLWGSVAQKSSVPVKAMDNVKSVFLRGHCVVVKTDGTLWGWGDNMWGQVGNGQASTTVSTPVKIMENIENVIVENEFSIALKTDGSLWAWGNDRYSVFGTPTAQTDKRILSPKKIFPN